MSNGPGSHSHKPKHAPKAKPEPVVDTPKPDQVPTSTTTPDVAGAQLVGNIAVTQTDTDAQGNVTTTALSAPGVLPAAKTDEPKGK